MKFSTRELVILVLGVVIVAPVVTAILTPSPDAITMGWVWLLAVSLFLAGFFLIRWLLRRR